MITFIDETVTDEVLIALNNMNVYLRRFYIPMFQAGYCD